MTGPPAAVAAVRVAVRAALRPYTAPGHGDTPGAGAPTGPLVLVACSGGADSLALAAATAFEAPRLGLRPGLVTVDHGLQEGSGARAAALADWARGRGFAPVDVVAVTVAGTGGPEGAARAARYAALARTAARRGAVAVLLGHSRDDQAETVLLALARGAGPRGLAGMPVARPMGGTTLLRPLLDLPRATLARSCADQGLPAWVDPHNADPAYARSRVRARLLPALTEVLGERVVVNLARTATLVAADNAALDALAADMLASARAAGAAACGDDPAGAPAAGDPPSAGGAARSGGTPPADGAPLAVAVLAAAHAAVRTRALHRWARDAGAPGGALAHRHVTAVDRLVTEWRGQGPVDLPGNLRVRRDGPVLRLL